MYGKYVNGRFVRAPYRISESDAIKQGYKPVVLNPAPETDDSHYPVERLEETEFEIVRKWELVELPPAPEYEPTTEDKAEAYDILIGGAVE